MTDTTETYPLILPFRGIRYAAGDLSQLLCPPYDIISPSEQRELYQRDPHNMIRLELTEPEGGKDRYQTAAAYWQQWRQEGVLREDEDSLYVLKAEFCYRGETRSFLGLFSGLHLEYPENGRVLPHERTLAAAKADRLALLKATHANFSPIWTIYHNPAVAEMIATACATAPVATADFSDGVKHTLWQISDPAQVQAICQGIGEGPIFIADGHHRYETAFAVSRELGNPGTAPSNYVLNLMVEANDPGLIILPTHRALTGNADAIEKMKAQFSMKACADLDALIQAVEASNTAVGFYSKQDGFQLVEVKAAGEQADTNPPVKLLHQEIITPLFGGDPAMKFYKVAADAQKAVDEGEYEAAFFLPPLRSQELIHAAKAVERLPQKSTYFWPKIPAGLVMRAIE